MKNVLFYLNALHIFSDGYSAAFLLLLPFITRDIHLSLTQAGLLGSSIVFITTFLAMPSGTLAVKFGGMRILTVAVLVYALAYILLSFASSFIILVPIFFLAAVGLGACHPIGFALVARLTEKKKRGRVVGTFTALGDTGKIAFTSCATFLIALVGWRNTSVLYGTTALLFFIFLIFTHLKNRSIHEKLTKPENLPFKKLLSNRKFMFASCAGLLDILSSYPLFVFLPFLLLQKGVPPVFLGSFVGVYFIGNLIGKVALGRLTDVYGHVKVFFIAELLTGLFIILLTFSANKFIIIILSLLLGTLTKGTAPVTQTMVTESVEHHENFEKSISFYSMEANIIATFGVILLGYVSDHFGISIAFILTACFALLAIIPAIGFHFEKGSLLKG